VKKGTLSRKKRGSASKEKSDNSIWPGPRSREAETQREDKRIGRRGGEKGKTWMTRTDGQRISKRRRISAKRGERKKDRPAMRKGGHIPYEVKK